MRPFEGVWRMCEQVVVLRSDRRGGWKWGNWNWRREKEIRVVRRRREVAAVVGKAMPFPDVIPVIGV
ncbi:hypothetical protein L1987_33798 [Smallanthus sonchifolius]|uniref:Uncharacterized protein n=1 Tax=Smallanthus sonchifolius TaxID=185202 RepID=A0ACB9HTH0_9ASTR|nr:hypothetical protein L1987_33798 [Smallanthus sonchifolius]